MRIVVVEDEEVVAARLIRLIGKILDDPTPSITHLVRLEDAIGHLARHTFDLLFLDLDLNGRDGFRLLRHAMAGSFQTIVVSARHDQALSALEHLLPARFTRVHRSYIVDTESIASYRNEPGSRYLVRLTTGIELPVGRSRFKEFRRRML